MQFDQQVLQLIQDFIDQRYPGARVSAITQLQNERYLVEVDDGVGRSSHLLYRSTTFGQSRMEQEPTFGRWAFDDDGREVYLGQ